MSVELIKSKILRLYDTIGSQHRALASFVRKEEEYVGFIEQVATALRQLRHAMVLKSSLSIRRNLSVERGQERSSSKQVDRSTLRSSLGHSSRLQRLSHLQDSASRVEEREEEDEYPIRIEFNQKTFNPASLLANTVLEQPPAKPNLARVKEKKLSLDAFALSQGLKPKPKPTTLDPIHERIAPRNSICKESLLTNWEGSCHSERTGTLYDKKKSFFNASTTRERISEFSPGSSTRENMNRTAAEEKSERLGSVDNTKHPLPPVDRSRPANFLKIKNLLQNRLKISQPESKVLPFSKERTSLN